MVVEKTLLFLLEKGAIFVGKQVVENLPEETIEKAKKITEIISRRIGLTSPPPLLQPIDTHNSDFSFQPLSKIYTNNPLQLAKANLHSTNISYSYCDEFTDITDIDLKMANMTGAILLLAYIRKEDIAILGKRHIEPLFPSNHKAILSLKDANSWLQHYLQANQLTHAELTHAGRIIATGYYFIQNKMQGFSLQMDCSQQEYQRDIEHFRQINRELIKIHPGLAEYKQHIRNYIDPLPVIRKFASAELIDNDYIGTEMERESYRKMEEHRKLAQKEEKKSDKIIQNTRRLQQEETHRILLSNQEDLGQSVLIDGVGSVYMPDMSPEVENLGASIMLTHEQQKTLLEIEAKKVQYEQVVQETQQALHGYIREKIRHQHREILPLQWTKKVTIPDKKEHGIFNGNFM